jgi:hypothetical protein
MLANFENDLSQIVGREVAITQLHMYDEQSGAKTTCVTGFAGRTRFRIVQGNGNVVTDPTQATWVAAGCTRPNYQLIH